METKNKNLTDCKSEVSGVNAKALVNIAIELIASAVYKVNDSTEWMDYYYEKWEVGSGNYQYWSHRDELKEARKQLQELKKLYKISKDGYSSVLGRNVNKYPSHYSQSNRFNWSSLKIDGRRFNSKETYSQMRAFSVPEKVRTKRTKRMVKNLCPELLETKSLRKSRIK